MPKYRITAPDGKTYNVTTPEGQDVNPEAILGALKAHTTPKPMSQDEYGTAKAANMAGLGFGVGDEVLAGLGAANNFIGGIRDLASQDAKKPVSFSADYNKQLKYIRGSQDKLNREDFGASITSNLIGGIPAALATGGPAAGLVSRALPNVGRVGNAAITGAGFAGAAGFGSGEGGVENRLVSAALSAPVGGFLGATVEGVVSPVVSRFITYLRGRPQLIDPAGNLTPEGQNIAQRAGIDPAEASAALRTEFGRTAQRATDPLEAAATAEAATLPVPVRLTQGQVTLSPSQQMFETNAAKEAYGQPAQRVMRDAFAAQDEALQGNVDAIRRGISGGAPIAERGQGVQAARNVLLDEAQALRARTNQLYTSAREANGNAFVLGRNAANGLVDIQNGLNNAGLTQRTAGRVHQIIQDAARDLDGVTQAVGREPNVSVGNLFAIRAELAALQRSSDQVESAAATQAKRSLDNWLNQAIDEDLITGDPATVELWRRAIASRREFGQRFERGDLVEKLVERVRGTNELKLDPQKATNLIFGDEGTKFVSSGNMLRELQTLRGELGADSQAWRSLKEEAFMRFASKLEQGATRPDGRALSGVNFAKAWEDALTRAPGTMRVLFSDQERALINQFARVARRVTTNVPGGNNSSNTAVGLADIGKRMFNSAFMGERAALILNRFSLGISDIAQELRATRSAVGRIQTGPQPTMPLGSVSPQADAALRASVPIGAQMGGNRQ